MFPSVSLALENDKDCPYIPSIWNGILGIAYFEKNFL